MSTISPEIEALLLCARTYLEAPGIERLGFLLKNRVNWEELRNMAYRHGVELLFFHRLKTSFPEMVPQNIWDPLHNRFLVTAARNVFLTRELIRIYNLFQNNGIAVIPFKGPVLASWAYGNLSLRPFGDLDILVRPHDIPRIMDLLAAAGYRWLTSLRPSQKEVYIRAAAGILTFQHPKEHTILELDPCFSANEFPCPIAVERLWDRLGEILVEGQWIATFSPEDLLILLCLHGAKHGWERLIWIADIAELLPKMEIDWQRAISEAQAWHCGRIVLLGLLLARALFGMGWPQELEEKMESDPRAAMLAREVKNRLTAKANVPSPSFSAADFFLLRASDRLLDKVRFSLRTLCLPTFLDWEALPLPPFFYFLYSLVRPLRLVVKYEMALLKKFLTAS